MEKEVSPLYSSGSANLNQTTSTAGIVTRLAIAEAALIEVEQRDRGLGRHHESIT